MEQYTISLKDIKEGMIIAEPISSTVDSGANMVIVNEGVVVTKRIISHLVRHRVRQLAVRLQEGQTLDTKPGQNPVAKVGAEPVIASVINDDLREEAISNIRSLFTEISNDKGDHVNMTTAYQTVKEFENIVNQLVAAVSSNPKGLVHVNDLKKYDEYTYHHSLSVAVLSIATGQELGLDFKQLFRLSQCAILHDIGKLSIPLEIINKPGKLNEEEYKIVKSHPIRGASSLKTKAFGNTEMWSSVMFHHEKINGTGYPRKLAQNEIPLFSRIITVCDVYDAVTSHRPYRKPMTPSNAYELVMSGVGTSFEYDIVKSFAKKLELYPINSIVVLSDGRRGIVVENINEQRPVVELDDTKDLLDLSTVKNLHLTIAELINPKEK